MLVLSRKLNEEIIIAGQIRVRVIAVKGNQVRLGIEAPPEVSVHREEVSRAIREFRDEDALLIAR
jgi:carbon storage regulator